MPDSLRRKIDLIIARAGISLNDEETFFEHADD